MARSLINSGTKSSPEAEISPSTSSSPSADAQHDQSADLPDIDLDDLLSSAAGKEEKAERIDLPAHVAGSGSLDRLIDQARDFASKATAENTNKAYKTDWAHFSSWCRRKGIDASTPSPAVVGLYLTDCAKPQDGSPALSVATLERRLSGVSAGYRQRGRVLDLRDRHIAQVWAGIKRAHGAPPVQKAALSGGDILAMTATLPYHLRGLRDRAILLVGFAGGLRRSEIVGLDLGRGDSDADGNTGRGWIEIKQDGVLLTLNTKTGWRAVAIGRGSSDQSCPVTALESYLSYARLDRSDSIGPVFRRTTRDNLAVTEARLSDRHVARLIKTTVLTAGIRSDLPDAARSALYSGHSLRAGLATHAQVDERHIQKHLGHASADMTRRYQRDRDRFKVNLTKAAGL